MSGCLSKYDGYTGYMSADTAGRREELDQQIATSQTKIEENSEIVRGLKRLSDENRIDQVLSRCKELRYEDKCWDYLQQELNVTFNMRDKDVRYRELGDVVFYYLLRDEEPVREIQKLIWIIDWMFATIEERSWYEQCTAMLGFSDVVFTQFCKRLENNPNVEYLIYKHPQLLLSNFSHFLINLLNEHLPHDNLHQILLNTRDENEQTFLFYNGRFLFVSYENKFDDLCELLSVRNKSGNTALHENSRIAYQLLLQCATRNNQDKVNELLSIRDNNNKTVYDTADDWNKKRLTWLKHQYEHKNYPLYDDPQVLILYNTNDRPGAEEEAESIQQAFEPVTDQIELKKMGTKREVLEFIKKWANDDTSGLFKEKAREEFSSALIVCLMSHGNIGTINDSEEEPITLTSIEGAMCSDRLKERPKILITQGCQNRARGRKRTQEEATCSNTDPGPSSSALVDNPPYEPTSDDFLSVQCCVSGQMSARNVFIPDLAEQIKRGSENDGFEDLVKNVSLKMRQKENEQIPIVKSTLRGNVCLKDRRPKESYPDDNYSDDESPESDGDIG